MRRAIGVFAFSVLALFLAPASQAGPITFVADLDGPSENPANASPGTGHVTVVFDGVLHTLDISTDFADLLGPTTVAHIHCCVAPPGTVAVAVTPGTLPGFPAGVTSGTYDAVIDLTLDASYTAGFLAANGGTAAGAEAGLLAGMLAGEAYFNIHTALPLGFPAGEIRGFLAVPEPGSLGLLLTGLGVLLARRGRRRAA